MTPGIVTTEVPIIVMIGSLISLLLFGKYTFIIAPIFFLILKNQVRRCPECDIVLEQKLQFSFDSKNDAVN